MAIERLHPPGDEVARCLVLRCPVMAHDLEDVSMAWPEEVATFAVQKRRSEHLSGRWLLHEALGLWGIDASLVAVERTEHRAPYLAYIAGVWKNTPLPSISLCHSNGWAYVALVEHGWCVGLDAESKDRGIQSNAFDMMAKGGELDSLIQHPEHAIEAWVAKESVQKALGLGMHLNPRLIEIPIGVQECIITIEKSKIQLKKWIHSEAFVACAFTKGSLALPTAEDALLDATRIAMADGGWGVGCNTTRNSV